MKPIVYLAGPISGLSFDQATEWRGKVRRALLPEIECLSPMRDKEYLANLVSLPSSLPDSSVRSLVARDFSDIVRSDLVFVNYIDAAALSRGTIWETGAAYALRKPIVLAIDENNPHDDFFLLESAQIRVCNLAMAVEAIRSFLLPG